MFWLKGMCLHIRTEKALNFELWSDSKKLVFFLWWTTIYILVRCSDASPPSSTIYNYCLIINARIIRYERRSLCLVCWCSSITNLIELVYHRNRRRRHGHIRYIRILFDKSLAVFLPLGKCIKFFHCWFVRLWIRLRVWEDVLAHGGAHCLFYDWFLIYIVTFVAIAFVSLLTYCLALSGSHRLRRCDIIISCSFIVKLLSFFLLLNLLLCVFPTKVILLDLLCFVFEWA